MGKNINSMIIQKLQQAVAPFIVESISALIGRWGAIERRGSASVEGKNFYFADLNQKHGWFDEVVSGPSALYHAIQEKTIGPPISTGTLLRWLTTAGFGVPPYRLATVNGIFWPEMFRYRMRSSLP